jgi:hypothetical protein
MSGSGQYQVIITFNSVYKSSDYGETWNLVNFPKIIQINLINISISISGQYQTIVEQNGIYISRDYGNSWILSLSGNFVGLSMSSSGQYQTVINLNELSIYTSNNYGNTWIKNTFDYSPYSLNKIKISSTGQYQLVAGDNSPIYISSDYGNNWIMYNLSPITNWGGIAISSSGQYVSGVIVNDRIYTCNNLINLGLSENTIGNKLLYNIDNNQLYNTSKTFVIEHPIDNDKYLVHSCIEGPESGVFYRGDGEIVNNEYTTIELPEYVSSFAKDFNIQITPIYNGSKKKYNVSKVENNKFKVYGNNGCFFWIVHAKRSDIIVEPSKKNIILKGHGPYKWI